MERNIWKERVSSDCEIRIWEIKLENWKQSEGLIAYMSGINIRNGSRIEFGSASKLDEGGSTKLLSNSRHTEFKFSAGRVNQPISSLFELCMYLGRIAFSDSPLSDSAPSLTLSGPFTCSSPLFSFLPRHLSSTQRSFPLSSTRRCLTDHARF